MTATEPRLGPSLDTSALDASGLDTPENLGGVLPSTLGVDIRRRRTYLVLALAATVSLGIAAGTGAEPAWVVFAVVLAAALGYLLLVQKVRNAAAAREMSLAFSDELDWSSFEAAMGTAPRFVESQEDLVPITDGKVDLSAGDLMRFVGAYAVGLALTPVVGLIRICGGDLSELRQSGVAARLVRARDYGRSQSIKMLAVGVVAASGATTIASVVGGPAAVASAAAAPHHTTYTVRSGDTLAKIAARYGVTVRALAAANHISDVNWIVTGETLVIPSGGSTTTTTTTSEATQTYTVSSGDTLSAIAQRYGMTLSQIVSINHISNANFIYVGEQLQVFASGGGGTGTSVPTSYTVRAGDTLYKIAVRFDTTVSALAEINHISNVNDIYVGEVLQLRGGTTTTDPGGGGGGTTHHHHHPSPSATIQQVAVKVALEQVGKPYAWGGAGPDAFDCSGLVMYAYDAAGVHLEHYTVAQYEETTRISQSQLEPGDLVFYDNYDGPQPGHVAMYIGNGRVVSANNYGQPVQTQSLSYDGTIIGFGRVSRSS